MEKRKKDGVYKYILFNSNIHTDRRPVIRGTRITIDDVLGYVGAGWSVKEVADELKLPREAVVEVLRFASEVVKEVKVFA